MALRSAGADAREKKVAGLSIAAHLETETRKAPMALETILARSSRIASNNTIALRGTPLAILFSALTVITLTALPHAPPVGTEPLAKRAAHTLQTIMADKVALEDPNQKIFAEEAAMSPRELLHRWDPLIAEASKKTGVPEKWIRAIMNTETGGRTVLENGPITSNMGAMGLMQVMPGTYAEMRAQYHLGADPYEPRNNIMAGAGYLRWLKTKFGFPNMFPAYNAGPGTYQNHLGGAALPTETVNYAIRVANFLGIAAPKNDGTASAGGAGDVKLTRPDGTAILVDADIVKSVRVPLPGEFADGVNAVLHIGKKKQGVREDPVTIAALIKKRGGLG
jgi:soluble lytic murein transglycosylase-like protein